MESPQDADAARLFYGPHPGIGGATVPLPSAVLQAITDLNGRVMPVARALATLQMSCPQGRFKVDGHPFRQGAGSIMLHLGPEEGPRHLWNLIHFREP